MDTEILFTKRLKELLVKDTSTEVMKSTISNLLSMISTGAFESEDFKVEILKYLNEIINNEDTCAEEIFICKELSLQLMVGVYDYHNGIKDYIAQCKELRSRGMSEEAISNYIIGHGITHKTVSVVDKIKINNDKFREINNSSINLIKDYIAWVKDNNVGKEDSIALCVVPGNELSSILSELSIFKDYFYEDGLLSFISYSGEKDSISVIYRINDSKLIAWVNIEDN